MVIPSNLLVNFAVDPAISAGLVDGSLQRIGGVIRDRTGVIVKHLVEVPGAGASVPVGLGLSSVAPMALAVGVGVVAVGVVVMARRLKALQGAVAKLDRRVEQGFTRLEGRLDAVDEQLGYLVALGDHQRAQQERLLLGLSELHRLELLKEVAALQSELQLLERYPEDGSREALRVAQRVRPLMCDQASRAAPGLEPQVMLRVDIAVRGWVVATASEAQILMQLGAYGEARQLVEEEQSKMQQLAEGWSQTLLVEPERPALSTAHRLGLTRSIPAERVARIARLHPADRDLEPAKQYELRSEAELELSLSSNAKLREGWAPREEAIAEYLDGMAELNDRLSSLGALAADCEQVGDEYYEALPDRNTAPGIYLLPPADAL